MRSATRRRRTIAIEAALTGHLVLSTLHTNDAPTAITRLVEMGVETFLVASAIDAWSPSGSRASSAIGARSPIVPELAELQAAGLPRLAVGRDQGAATSPAGCSACSNTGYRGRMGLYEVMTMTEEIERLTVDRASSDSIRRVAIEQGMIDPARRRLAEGDRAGITSIGRGREGGEVTMSVLQGQEDDVQVPVPELLGKLLEMSGSDLHLTAGAPPTVRVHGELERLDDYPMLTPRGAPGHDLRDPAAEDAGAVRAGAGARHVLLACPARRASA